MCASWSQCLTFHSSPLQGETPLSEVTAAYEEASTAAVKFKADIHPWGSGKTPSGQKSVAGVRQMVILEKKLTEAGQLVERMSSSPAARSPAKNPAKRPKTNQRQNRVTVEKDNKDEAMAEANELYSAAMAEANELREQLSKQRKKQDQLKSQLESMQQQQENEQKKQQQQHQQQRKMN